MFTQNNFHHLLEEITKCMSIQAHTIHSSERECIHIYSVYNRPSKKGGGGHHQQATHWRVLTNNTIANYIKLWSHRDSATVFSLKFRNKKRPRKQGLRQQRGDTRETKRKDCGDAAETVRKDCGDAAETVRKDCGMQRKYCRDTVEMLRKRCRKTTGVVRT